jgi:hypothetical protein
VLEELWDAVDDESDNQMSDQATQEVEESIMDVHDSDKPVSAKCKTFRFIANVGKDKVLVLIDSGSVGTFVSEQLVQKLKLPTQSCPSATFKAADGGILTCTQMVPEMKWYAQGHTFSSAAQVLPLKCFDMILGEDWLEAMSPIWVDYRHKKMKITYEGHRLTLQGIQDTVSPCQQLSGKKVKGLLRTGMVSCCFQILSCTQKTESTTSGAQSTNQVVPPEVDQLVQEYDFLFATPTALPPHKKADHMIPLIPGAQPVKVRPYRYSPI